MKLLEGVVIMHGLHTESLSQPPRVLVVDDDAPTVRMIQFLLEGEGFLVSCANDAERALTEFSRERVDLVLLNVVMPGLDGFELYDRLVSRGYQGPVVFVSARPDVCEIVDAREIQSASCLVKPLHIDDVTGLIKRLLPCRV